MRITRIRALAALAAVARRRSPRAAPWRRARAPRPRTAAAAEEVNACRHPNGGWVGSSAPTALPGSGASGGLERRGPKGDPGPPGLQTEGRSAAEASELGDLRVACTTDGGDAGKVKLDFAGDDTVLFRCVAGGTPPPLHLPPPHRRSSSTRSTTTRWNGRRRLRRAEEHRYHRDRPHRNRARLRRRSRTRPSTPGGGATAGLSRRCVPRRRRRRAERGPGRARGARHRRRRAARRSLV